MQRVSSTKIKFFLFLFSFLIAVGILIYSQIIVSHLQKVVQEILRSEKKIAILYANTLEYIASSEDPNLDYQFFFDKIIPSIDFPMIETDANEKIVKGFKNLDIEKLFSKNDTMYIIQLAKKMDEKIPPILVKVKPTPTQFFTDTVLEKIHYGESKTVLQLQNTTEKLEQLPIVEITLGILFIFVAYMGFSYVKRNEQNKIWIGMSKETAHQLGTPLSSLNGWIEILKSKFASEEIQEMENDVVRLNKIAERFSKIGSKENLKTENIVEIIQRTKNYFEKRNSQFGTKNIQFQIQSKNIVNAKINFELIEWVFENMIKNSLDAIGNNSGKINFKTEEKEKSIEIEVSDSGKGIEGKLKKQIFTPGFTTKERGWGLGLSLAKRIVEDYHKGKLELQESKIGVGTTFKMKLPK